MKKNYCHTVFSQQNGPAFNKMIPIQFTLKLRNSQWKQTFLPWSTHQWVKTTPDRGGKTMEAQKECNSFLITISSGVERLKRGVDCDINGSSLWPHKAGSGWSHYWGASRPQTQRSACSPPRIKLIGLPLLGCRPEVSSSRPTCACALIKTER